MGCNVGPSVPAGWHSSLSGSACSPHAQPPGLLMSLDCPCLACPTASLLLNHVVPELVSVSTPSLFTPHTAPQLKDPWGLPAAYPRTGCRLSCLHNLVCWSLILDSPGPHFYHQCPCWPKLTSSAASSWCFLLEWALGPADDSDSPPHGCLEGAMVSTTSHPGQEGIRGQGSRPGHLPIA